MLFISLRFLLHVAYPKAHYNLSMCTIRLSLHHSGRGWHNFVYLVDLINMQISYKSLFPTFNIESWFLDFGSVFNVEKYAKSVHCSGKEKILIMKLIIKLSTHLNCGYLKCILLSFSTCEKVDICY